LSQATLEACRDVFGAEIPHYFRHLYDKGDRSVAPRIEYASGLDGDNPKCAVSIIGCTGDWFGGWDGLTPGSVNQFVLADGTGGRMPEVIDRGEPAIMVCHWPGIYYNGERIGFNILKEIVKRLDARYGKQLIWMKLSEIARYWAAKELTRIESVGNTLKLQAPFGSPRFTLEIATKPDTASGTPTLKHKDQTTSLKRIERREQLAQGTFFRSDKQLIVCFDLPKGASQLLQS
jgi:hypothetical protein